MSDTSKKWIPRVLLLVALVPLATAIIRSLLHRWFPIGDNALLYIRAQDVLTNHHPWLGSWTSASQSVGVDMNNPGPIYADLVAPFAKLFSPGPGAALGVGAINIASIVALSAAARRIGGWALQQWALLGAAALAWSMGSEMLIDIWQAHALMLPFLLLLVLLLGVADGQTWCIPWSLVVISLLAQTHISFAYILAVLCPVAAIGYALARRARPHRPLRDAIRSRLVMWTAVGLFALWSQSLYEQFFEPGEGNLSRLAANSGGGDLQVGVKQALGVTARLFAFPPWWFRSGFATSVPSTAVTGTPDAPQLLLPNLPATVISLALVSTMFAILVALVVYHRRRGAHVLAAICTMGAACLAGSVLAVSQLTVGRVGFSSHHVRFIWPLAVFAHLALGSSAADWVQRSLSNRYGSARMSRVVSSMVVGSTIALSIAAVPYFAQPQGPVGDYRAMAALRRVMPELDRLHDVQPVLFDISNLHYFEPYSSTIMMRLQELDIEFRVDDEGFVRQLGERRRADGTEPARIFQIQGSPALLAYDEYCLIAIASELPPEKETIAVEYADRMAQELADGLITIDDSVLSGPDVAIEPVMRTAIAGDFSAAQRIVYEGYLSRWYSGGGAQSDRSLVDDFVLVDRYMNSVYALFSDQTEPCL